MELHGNPHMKFKSIHIAGTNGKGSVSTMLSEILRKNDYKTGLYTSPHFKDYRERIRINAKKISKSFVSNFVGDHMMAWEEIQPSFFEITVAMAFSYFAEQEVDIAVIEVGMGGRLDSTNVLSPELGIITRIAMDHQQFLGDSLEKIAGEKAGIIKDNMNLVLGENKQVVIDKVEEVARNKNAKVIRGQAYEKDLPAELPLYQRENIGTVLSACDSLIQLGWTLDKSRLEQRILKTLKGNKLKGRWQILGQRPLIVAEAAHNESGIAQLLKQLEQCKYDKLHIVFGCSKDKEASIFKLLPKDAHYYFCKADIPRGLETEKLMGFAVRYSWNAKSYESVNQAFTAAKANASDRDMVLVTGSIFVIAELL